MIHTEKNMIPNGNFQVGEVGFLPYGWEIVSPYPALKPLFELASVHDRKVMQARGNSNENCIGYIRTMLQMNGGQTYRMRVRFRMSDGLDPNKNLLFACYAKTASGVGYSYNDGIFKFNRTVDGWVEGENRFLFPVHGILEGEVRIYFRFNTDGLAWFENISLDECEQLPPRKVRLACTNGVGSLETWRSVLDFAGKNHVDAVLLPETFCQAFTRLPVLENIEGLDGSSCSLLSDKAREHGMYTAGTFIYRDDSNGAVYNTAVLFDRTGNLLGKYYKNHPYSPELDRGITPGVDVPVFQTDFGTVGIMICYDSWFSDIAELLALKGAEILLFPNAGYYRSLMPARAADNCVRIVASSHESGCGLWDTAGVDVQNPNADSTCHSKCDDTFCDVLFERMGSIEILIATLDFNKSPSPHNWGGPMMSAPGGRRNRREQKHFLWEQIRKENERW